MLKAYIKAENLKHTHTVTAKLFWLVPLFAIVIPVFLSTQNAGYYYQMNQFNWSYTTFYPMLLLLSAAFAVQREKKLKNRVISALPIDLNKVWAAKAAYILKTLAVSAIIIYAAEETISRIFAAGGSRTISGPAGFEAVLLWIILILWQIPLWLFVFHILGFAAGMILGLAGNIALGVLGALSKWWLLNPFTYINRLMCPVLKILPNNLPAVPESQTYFEGVLNPNVIPRGIVASLLLFIVLYILTAKWYQREGETGWEN